MPPPDPPASTSMYLPLCSNMNIGEADIYRQIGSYDVRFQAAGIF